ncbi:helix-turn-helix domain-containing protein [Streptomyces sp. LP05-1]|uniref:Helix-turn-helix domain-containing protein n=1 Tax=Streptomyces pyxinae TaxID=2970734 RepID=A0ABT2CIE8_9ACTN|nr:XRE family transcriptional regulator [Streptomyces sp. LP05-1]MCS0636872.1 helix-turn-helix domain-containing protein [Streptomyces sp. LP05-1]
MAGEFGDVLRRLRGEAGLTQEGLAERSGVSVRTIRGLETGQRANPRMTTVQQLAGALEPPPGDREELLRAAGLLAEAPAPDRHPGTSGSGADGSMTGASGAARRTPDGPAPAPPGPAEDPGGLLARLVRARWRHEEEQRRIQDPFPLPVRWRTAREDLTDHWANILRLPPEATAGALDLAGRLDGIAGTYRRVPSGRLVILGRSGSGKTVLALRFVLDHLASREPGDPVPVIFSIGAWDPTALTLRDWLAAQLTRDYPGHAVQGSGGRSLAAELVESGRVLPVLDGFDEMADGLRRPALEALNATPLPLLLTSRPAEYAAAVAETDVLTSAAAIELTDLTLDDLAGYLPRTTRKSGRTLPAANTWDPVLTELREQARRRPVPPLARVLTTPLMVALARTIYSDTPDHDPASLLDTERFGTQEALEEHLLDNFLPTVYRPRPGPRGAVPAPVPGPGFERAQRWLGHLAHHLDRLGTPDLAWWRLGSGPRRSTRTLITALLTGLAIGLVDGAVITVLPLSVPQTIVDATAVGLLSGLMFGLAHWLTFTVKDLPVTPSAVRLRIRGRPGPLQWSAGPRLVIGTLGGAVFGFGYGGVIGVVKVTTRGAGLSDGLRTVLIDGSVMCLVFGGGTGLTFCLLGLFETPLDIRSAVDPRSLLGANRRTVTARLVLWAVAFGAIVGFGSGAVVGLLGRFTGPLVWSPVNGLVLGVVGGVGGSLGYTLTLTAWGQWAVLTRIWLPLTGRLPWAVMAFLEDACRRGVLRQAGAVYQFRHARLQQHLAHTHRRRMSTRRRRISRRFPRSALPSASPGSRGGRTG